MRPSLFGRPGVSAAIRILQISKQLRENPGLGYATAFISVGAASGLHGWRRTNMPVPRS
jgi:hypothetical protein